ncbi:TPR repeat-containing protein [Calothrix sp. NIES-4101]|nr:TPR repeat-containing protein [Calothrix sp. NIES-4101]
MLNAGEEQDLLACEFQVLSSEVNEHLVWCDHADNFTDLGYYDAAINAYQQALKIKPNYQDAWLSLGAVLCDKLEQYEEALMCFDNALRINYLDDFAWYNRGNVLEHLQRYEDALACYNIVLKFNPNDESAWYSHGWVSYELGNYENAIASFEQALKLKPDDDSAWYNKACCYALQGDIEQVVICLRQAIQRSPNQYYQMLKTEADFDDIRHDIRFQTMMQESLLIE